MNDNIVISLRNIHKYFGDLHVLKGISLDVSEGEVLVIIGPSGCGKSTLLRCINLLEHPDEGDVVFEGQNILEKGVDINKIRTKLGIVFQSYNLFPHMSVHGNVAFGLTMRGVDRTLINERVSEVLDVLHITHLEDKKPHELSGGERQKVALARVLVLTPRLLLCDEPFSALDTTARYIAKRTLEKVLRELEIPAVLVSHDPEEVSSLASSVYVMEGKKLEREMSA